jgi:hypothetical protein
MSEQVEKELEELKQYLINEYRNNGGDKDVTNYTAAMLTDAIESQKKINLLKKELTALKTGATPKEIPLINSVDSAKENQSLAKKAAGIMGAYMNYIDPPWDERALEDERFLRDNEVLKLSVKENDPSVVILRDAEGRLA